MQETIAMAPCLPNKDTTDSLHNVSGLLLAHFGLERHNLPKQLPVNMLFR
jgi:hypothetical protein